MATVPSPHTFIAGDNATSSVMNTLTTGINFLLRPPLMVRHNSTTQSIPTGGTGTALTFDTSEANSDGIYGSSASQFTIQTPGTYRLTASCQWAANGTGTRALFFLLSTGQVGLSQVAGSASDPVTNNLTATVYMVAGVTVQVMVVQDSGGALSTVSSALMPRVEIAWVSA